MILAGDVGATKTLLGLFRPVKGELRCVREESVRVILEPRTALLGAARCATANAPSRKNGKNGPKSRKKRR